MPTECKRYSSNAHIPKRAYSDCAGYDLWVTETKVLKPCSRELIRFDLFMVIPKMYYGRIVRHSALANTCGIVGHNGTIDSDNQEKVCVVLFNLSNGEYVVKTCNCIAESIIECCFMSKFVKVTESLKEGRRVLVYQVFNFFKFLKS